MILNLVILIVILILVTTLYLGVSAPVEERFSDKYIPNIKSLKERRGDSSKIIVYPDHNDKVYVRLLKIVMDEPALYENDIKKIVKLAKISKKSVILDAGCGTGKHLKYLKKITKGSIIESVDKSRSMINQAQIENPSGEFLCSSITIPELYKLKSLTHILCLHDTLYHNSPKEISDILNNFHNWLVPEGYLAVHVIDPNKLDPAPRAFSQYYKTDENVRKALTYFEGFTHEAWWEKEKNKNYWYRYCQKFIFPNKKTKIQTTPLWIPPVNFMLQYITKHNFELKEIVDLSDIDVVDFSLYIFRKKKY